MIAKKGNVNAKIGFLVGALIIVVLATALAPVMFDNIDLFQTTTEGGNSTDACGTHPDLPCGFVPTWLPTVLVVIVGAGIVFLIWKSFSGAKFKKIED